MAVRNLVVNRTVAHALRDVASQASGRLIDIGCGMKPCASIFEGHVAEHVGVDHADTLHGTECVDLIGTAYDIPADDGSFDTVLCTAVMEHLEEPQAAIIEARRVLRDGGVAIYTIPLFWQLHEAPRDFYRYTRYGIEHLFEQGGFDRIEVRPLGGYWLTAGTMFSYYLDRFARGPFTPLIGAITLAVQAAAAGLDRADRATDWTWMYLVVAYAAEHPRGEPGDDPVGRRDGSAAAG